MEYITAEHINNAINKIEGMDDDALSHLIETFVLEQNSLAGYSLQAAIEFQNEELNDLIMYYFAIIYQSFKNAGYKMGIVEDDLIDAFQEPFHEALDLIHTTEDYSEISSLINQPVLENWMVDEIGAEDSEGNLLGDETQIQLYLVTMNIIGLLNKVANG
ncbi:MAG: hypothetical protein KDC84_03380 [Crocinitomicaceae bacterium]|nr:hypothetical protein [Crocinitomicaceae bacterium]